MAEVENKGVSKSKRDAMLERLRGRYPDKEYADDEELFGQISDDYDDYDSQISGYKDREGQLSKMFTSDPRSAQFLTNWKDGGDPVVELIRSHGKETILEAINDPEKLEEIAAANKEYLERVSESKKLDEEYETNIQQSLESLDQFKQERGLSDEEADAVFNFLQDTARNGIRGIYSLESYDMALKAIGHDTDVASASAEGEVRGRNARIDEELRKREEGDGTVVTGGKPMTPGRKNENIFDLARRAR